MNPIANKTVTRTVATNLEQGQGQSEIQKTGPSKFDQVRAQQMENTSPPVDLPPAVTQVSPAQTQTLQAELRQRVQSTSSNPADLLKVDLGNTGTSLNQLTKRVSALPNSQATDPIRSRLMSIDQQYKATGQLFNNGGQQMSQQDLLNAQTQIYLMSENISLVSKVVDQVTGGVKTLLQTQV